MCVCFFYTGVPPCKTLRHHIHRIHFHHSLFTLPTNSHTSTTPLSHSFSSLYCTFHHLLSSLPPLKNTHSTPLVSSSAFPFPMPPARQSCQSRQSRPPKNYLLPPQSILSYFYSNLAPSNVIMSHSPQNYTPSLLLLIALPRRSTYLLSPPSLLG